MASRDKTPIDLSFATPEPSIALSTPSAFSRIMRANSSTVELVQKRDRCRRPTPTYNYNYDPNKPPPEGLPGSYSPYVNGEPLFDDRAVVVIRLLAGYIVAPTSKKP